MLFSLKKKKLAAKAKALIMHFFFKEHFSAEKHKC